MNDFETKNTGKKGFGKVLAIVGVGVAAALGGYGLYKAHKAKHQDDPEDVVNEDFDGENLELEDLD